MVPAHKIFASQWSLVYRLSWDMFADGWVHRPYVTDAGMFVGQETQLREDVPSQLTGMGHQSLLLHHPQNCLCYRQRHQVTLVLHGIQEKLVYTVKRPVKMGIYSALV